MRDRDVIGAMGQCPATLNVFRYEEIAYARWVLLLHISRRKCAEDMNSWKPC